MRQGATPIRRKFGRGGLSLAALATSVVVLCTACSSLLDVDIPGRVEAGALDDPRLASTLVSSALGQFECAYAAAVATTGVLSEEYIVSSYFVNANIWGWRGVETKTEPGNCAENRNASNLGYYTPMQAARYMAEDGIARINTFDDADVPDKAELLAQLAVYGAYSYVLLGENYCEMAFDAGPIMQPDEVLATAEAKFTDAISLAEAAGDDDLRNMALIGRARVRLDLGKKPEAAADAEQIPEGYMRVAEYSESRPRRENRVYNLTIRNDFLSVGPNYRDLTVGGEPDPRVPVLNTGEMGQDGVTEQWAQQLYTSAGSSIPVASWKEAQLILAEALGGQDAKDAINRVRAADGVPALDGSEGSDITALVLEERRRVLFSQGQRLNDMLRHDIPFPSGTNHKGQTYGPTTCIPLPDVERLNNPNAT